MTHSKELKNLKIEKRTSDNQNDSTTEKTAGLALLNNQPSVMTLSSDPEHAFETMSSNNENSGINLSLRKLALQIEALQKRIQQPFYMDNDSKE